MASFALARAVASVASFRRLSARAVCRSAETRANSNGPECCCCRRELPRDSPGDEHPLVLEVVAVRARCGVEASAEGAVHRLRGSEAACVGNLFDRAVRGL